MPYSGGLYYEWHGADDGETLILSPGLGGSAAYWMPNVLALAEHYRVLLYSHLGTGHGDPPTTSTSVEAMAADVAGLMDDMEVERAHFVGHALGAMIGLELASTSSRIGKLVAVNCWRALDPHTNRCFETRLNLLWGSGVEAYLRAQPLFLYPPDWISSHDADLEAETLRHLSAFPAPQTVRSRVDAVRAYVAPPSLSASTDLLVIGTRDDFLVPVHRVRELAEAIPGARYTEMDWGGHACNVTDPDTFNRIVLDFLRS